MVSQGLTVVMNSLYIGRRAIVRVRDDRYIIYLPRPLNEVWKQLQGKKVKVYIVIE